MHRNDLVVDLKYFSFSHRNRNNNLTHLPKHEFLSPNTQFCQRIWYVEYYSVYAGVVWSQIFRKSEISLDTRSDFTSRSFLMDARFAHKIENF